MNRERREFLRNAFWAVGGGIAGLGALYRLGGDALVNEALAENIAVMGGHINAGGGPASWADWTEASEASLVDGPDGGDVFVIFGDSATGENESGQEGSGGLTGGDLEWTQSGNVAGDGSCRTLDGGDDYFTMTNNCRNYICGESAWTAIFKLEDWNPDEAYEAIFHFGTSDLIVRRNNLTNNLQVYVEASTGTTAGTWNTSGVLYVAVWSGDGVCRAGYTTTRPTKWSDFAANDRVTVAASEKTIGTAETPADVLRDAVSDNRNMKTKWHYAVLAKKCLIDNAA